MPNNPYDDLMKNLARLIEQVTGLDQNMRYPGDNEYEAPRIIGCAIITSETSDQEIPLKKPFEVGYEIVDAGEVAYLTIALPSSLSELPEIEFDAEKVFITAGGARAPVDLSFQIIPESCSFTITNGVVDITLTKAVIPADITE
nr:CS domain-containing protein [uncultured Methanospirillum sp.]